MDLNFNYLFNFCGVFIALLLIYKIFLWILALHMKYGIPGPKPWPFIGNILALEKDSSNWDIKYQKLYGDIYPIYMGEKPIFVVSDEEMLKQILLKGAKSFIDRPIFRITSKLSKHGLLELKGKDWERVRALVSPAFTSKKLKNMFSMIDKSVKEMIDNLSSTTNMNCKEVFSLLTMNVIAKTMFGMEINAYSEPSNQFLKHAQALIKFSSSNLKFIVSELFHLTRFIEYLFPNGFLTCKSAMFLEKCVYGIIESRTESDEEHNDFLALMLETHNELKKDHESVIHSDKISYSGLTKKEIAAQSILFLVAGHESTSAVLTFCSYYLAMNPGIQNEVYQEILENIPDKNEMTYDTLANLNLLDQVVNECLRICPPVSRISRQCTKDTTLISSTGETIQAKKGMCFKIPINAIHHDERLWPEPNKFDIHRFDSEKNGNQFSFMPFGRGPRMCIGMRFALLHAKLTLAKLLLKYKIIPCDETPEHLRLESHTLTTTKEPVIVALRQR